MKRIFIFTIALVIFANFCFAQAKKPTKEKILDIIKQVERNDGLMLADMFSEKLISFMIQNKNQISDFSDSIFDLYSEANDKERLVCLYLFNRIIGWGYRVDEASQILVKHANNVNDPCYVLAIDLFLKNNSLSISLLKENQENEIDIFLKRLIFYYRNHSCNKNGVSNETKLLTDFLGKFQSPALTSQAKLEIASGVRSKFSSGEDLCRVAKVLYENKNFELSKKIYELILERPIGLDHDEVELANTIYKRNFKDIQKFPIPEKMFKKE